MIGKTLAHYEVTSPLGAGGMGEVYRARDKHLDREVALKFLPAALVEDPEHLARFEREAKLLASLTHPNIAVVHGLHEVDNTRFLAMELVPGEDLSATIARAPLPPAEAVGIAVQVAEALAAAHDQQVIHRDLKPANIMLTPEGKAKVLDFGLAKSMNPATPTSDLTHSPTMTAAATMAGMILGTAHYMSPEQARGRPVDRRSDLWSFGCVLYEMLTQKKPFAGETVTDVFASIIHKEPDWEAIPADVPRGVVRIIKRCLRKDVADRYRDAGDVGMLLLEALAAAESETAPAPGRKRSIFWPVAAVAFAAAFVGALISGGFGEGGTDGDGASVGELEQLTDLPGMEINPSLSADGRFILYVARGERGDADIFVQRVGGENPTNLTAQFPSNDFQPAFSPDGERIAFASFREGGGIFVMGATGESPIRVSDEGFDPEWSPDGTRIAYTSEYVPVPTGRSAIGRLWIVDPATGERTQVFEDDGIDAVDPAWSPSGARIAFTNAWSVVNGQRDVWTVPAGGGAPVPVIQDKATDWGPAWSADGAWLYFMSDRGGPVNLWRIRIDEQTGEAHGEPQRVTSSPTQIRAVSFSGDGLLAAVEIRGETSEAKIASFDPAALELLSEPELLPAGRDVSTGDLSPDGRRIAYATNSPGEFIYVVGADGTGRRRLIHDGNRNRGPTWSPDGRWITFYSNRGGTKYDLWAVRPDGTELQILTDQAESMNQPQWTRNWEVFVTGSTPGRFTGRIEVEPWGEDGPQGLYTMEIVPGTEGFAGSDVSPSGKHLFGRGPDALGQFQMKIFDVERGTARFIDHPDGGNYPTENTRLPGWLDDHRVLFWSGRDQEAVVLDIRDDGITAVPGLPWASYGFNAASGKLLMIEWTEEADIWLLRFGGTQE